MKSPNRKKPSRSYSIEEEITWLSLTGKNKVGGKPSSKRPATSPAKGAVHKRSAFGDITNAGVVNVKAIAKPEATKKVDSKKNKTKRHSLRLSKQVIKTKQDTSANVEKLSQITQDFFISSSQETSSSSASSVYESLPNSPATPTCFIEHKASPRRRALNFTDVDAENVNNINEAPEYAFTIFEYMRAREQSFPINENYMVEKQTEITPEMRSILVDWMVEVQENFELNHETLYLAVKLVDCYLQQVKIKKEKLQLIGATSLLIAAKFDERQAPYLDDFLYICDDAYNKQQMMQMERTLLKTIGFDINIPIAYRFLRRYAKCAKSSMEVLTLARYIMELSLQDISFIGKSASLMAASALWLAFKMKKTNFQWNDTLVYYSSHNEQDIIELAVQLNHMLSSRDTKLKTIFTKYSHSIFYQVAKTTCLSQVEINEETSRIQHFTQL
uniref:G2/mitotic-specific cyclin-B3 isoform X1 n=1 Tax=Ciona intestinalis TaxID=7719 RepID=UPI000180BFD2|nr:G2/mitotic-specific cyclin-B3 isoform X1 [Ciona intestinalis]|eukprot:XP_026693916.1 G2/mitotic-specific cyclin-B3 isoform X1 [Ciona intestinalis]